MNSSHGKTAVVTGASSGIGAATAVRLAREGFAIVMGARRTDRLEKVAAECGPGTQALPLDVTDRDSVAAFAGEIENLHVLVNNAGLASGMQNFADLDEERVALMWETNVLGLLRVTWALLDKVLASGEGHIVNLGSIAGFEAYPGGGGYTASKHAVRALTKTMRKDLLGKPVRITEICPGLVETEFSVVRFDGDRDRAAAVYKGIEPLVAEDIADCIAWAVTRPSHVNIDEIVLMPVTQASATMVAREDSSE